MAEKINLFELFHKPIPVQAPAPAVVAPTPVAQPAESFRPAVSPTVPTASPTFTVSRTTVPASRSTFSAADIAALRSQPAPSVTFTAAQIADLANIPEVEPDVPDEPASMCMCPDCVRQRGEIDPDDVPETLDDINLNALNTFSDVIDAVDWVQELVDGCDNSDRINLNDPSINTFVQYCIAQTGGEIIPDPIRTRMIAQCWEDTETMMEFYMELKKYVDVYR